MRKVEKKRRFSTDIEMALEKIMKDVIKLKGFKMPITNKNQIEVAINGIKKAIYKLDEFGRTLPISYYEY